MESNVPTSGQITTSLSREASLVSGGFSQLKTTFTRADIPSITALSITPLVILIIHYYGMESSYYRSGIATEVNRLLAEVDSLSLKGLMPYLYWSFSICFWWFFVPFLIANRLFKTPLNQLGMTLRGCRRHWLIYCGLYFGILPIIILAAYQPSFIKTYPFYKNAVLGGVHLWTFELLYCLQFFATEAFFRGYLLFTLHKRMGDYAIVVMTMPYVLIHIGKPFPEAVGAIIAGVVLGFLAIRTGSFILGVVLHCAVALTMDFMALTIHLGGFSRLIEIL